MRVFELIVDPNHYYAPMAFETKTGVSKVNPAPTGNYCVIEIKKDIEQYASLKTLNIMNVINEISLDEAVTTANRIHFAGHKAAVLSPNACVIRHAKTGDGCVVLVK